MREKIKNIPILGKFIEFIYYYVVTIYKFVTHHILREYISWYRWNKMKHEILKGFSDSTDSDIRELIENIRNQGTIRVYNYPFYEKYRLLPIEVFLDDRGGASVCNAYCKW